MIQLRTAPARKRKLLVVHGEKGGIGKSLLARLMVSFLHTTGLSMSADQVGVFDADGEGEGRQLTRTVPGAVPIDLTDPISSAQILDTLMGTQTMRVAVLDLGARQHRELSEWLYAADVGALVEEGVLEITILWLVGSTVDSVAMLSSALATFDECHLVCVLNRFFGDDFPAFTTAQDLQERLAARNAPSIELPVLAPKIARIVDAIPAPLHEISLPAGQRGETYPQVGFSHKRILGTWAGDIFARLMDPSVRPLVLPADVAAAMAAPDEPHAAQRAAQTAAELPMGEGM